MHATARRLSALLAGILFAATLAGSAAGGTPRYTGQLEFMHGDNFATGRSVANRLLLKTADRTYTLAFDGTGPRHLAGREVTVTGTRASNLITVSSLAVAASGTGSTSTTSTVVASTTKRVAVLLFNFQNDTRQPYTPSFANGVVFTNANSVANYFAEESYGQYAVTGDVFGWFTIAYDNTGCSYAAWATAARSAATAAGATLSNYTNFVYAFPSASGCGWSGLAYLPGTETWNNSSMTLRTNAHELSHNFGVHHASTISCTENGVRVALSADMANCSLSEYGDPFSVMGAAQTRHSHAEHKAQMTWVPTAERLDATASGTYTVGVQEQSSASPKVVRVVRTGATNQYFYLDFRQPFGSLFDNFSASDPAVTGVTIRVAPDYGTRSQSWLVDTTPDTASYNDAPLAVGRTFSDPLSGVSITTQSVSSSGATVRVSIGGASADTQAPTAPTNLVASAGGMTSMGLTWTASTDNVGVTGYDVGRDGTKVATVTGTTWSDSGLAAGTSYTYTVTAHDAAGNVSGAATASGLTASDTQAPSAPTSLVATPVGSTGASLTWVASSDNVGVSGYRVSRNGTQVATVTTTAWSDSGLSTATTYDYSVVAYDAAGNVSAAATASVTLTSGDTQPPTSPVLTVTVNSRRQTNVSWTTSTDNVGVAGYRVYQNGVLVATTTKKSWSPRRVSGTFTYYVVAFDKAGNVSAPSNSVTVTVA